MTEAEELTPEEAKALAPAMSAMRAAMRAALNGFVGEPTAGALKVVEAAVNDSIQALAARGVLPTAKVTDVTLEGDTLTVTIRRMPSSE